MSIFSDDWRDCLREQYKHVVRAQDDVTHDSLVDVMQQVGFGENELKELGIRATARVEDVPDDFVPDLDVLKPAEDTAPRDFQPHPLECQCPECMQINLAPHDEDGQPITDEDVLAEIEEQRKAEEDDDTPKQLSMF